MFIRDTAACVAIFGFATSAWFGWAQESPPQPWLLWLRIGSFAGLLLTIVGGLLVWRHWSDGTVFDAYTSPRFGIAVGIEFALCGIGAGILGARGHSALIAAWIALIVGLHFFPLAVVLKAPSLHLVAVGVTVAAVAGYFIARSAGHTISAGVGALTGGVFIVASAISLGLTLTTS